MSVEMFDYMDDILNLQHAGTSKFSTKYVKDSAIMSHIISLVIAL